MRLRLARQIAKDIKCITCGKPFDIEAIEDGKFSYNDCNFGMGSSVVEDDEYEHTIFIQCCERNYKEPGFIQVKANDDLENVASTLLDWYETGSGQERVDVKKIICLYAIYKKKSLEIFLEKAQKYYQDSLVSFIEKIMSDGKEPRDI